LERLKIIMKIQTKEQLAKYFDHTILDCMATEADIRRHCQEAVDYGFYAACVQPRWVSFCANLLHGTDVKVVSVTKWISWRIWRLLSTATGSDCRMIWPRS
ncbi:MAG: hypothetical protein ACYSOW_04400, partial [Planctomycetota bacterium]